MATANPSLFGMLGDEEAMQRQLDEQRAKAFAEQTQEQRLASMGYKAGSQLGRGIAGAFGVDVTDPVIRQASQLRQMASQFDTTTPEGLMQYAQAIRSVNPDLAMQAAAKAQELQKLTSEASMVSSKADLEAKLRNELANLPADATDEDILKVVTKYGSADKVMAALQSSQARKEAAQARKEQAAASDATKLEIARMNNETRQFLGNLTNSLKDKPLSSTDLKMVNEARQAFQAADFNLGEAKTFIGLLDDKKMNFGAGENALSVVRTVLGSSNESDQNKINLQQWVEKASADVLRMDVGVKTEGDAQRAKSQVLSALSKNDAKAVKTSLEQYVKVLENAKSIQQDKLTTIATERNRPGVAEVPSRRQTGTADNPIVLK